MVHSTADKKKASEKKIKRSECKKEKKMNVIKMLAMQLMLAYIFFTLDNTNVVNI